MGKAGKLLGTAILALLLAPAARAAEAARPLDYGYPEQSVWTARTTATGEADNPLLRLAAELFRRVEVPWQARPLPAARLFDALREGRTDFSMLVNGAALATCCLVSRQPVATTELRIYRHGSRPPVGGLAGLAGQDIITIHGYSYGSLAAFLRDPANRVVVHAAPTHAAAFAMLARGRAGYVLDYAGPAEETLADAPIGGVAWEVIDRLRVHLVLRRSYPDAESLMPRLEQAAAAITAGETRP